jgi:small-conductance mechanosensitive channel
MAMEICDVMKESGIEIPFPQRDLHIRSTDPGLAKRDSALTGLAQGQTPVEESGS